MIAGGFVLVSSLVESAFVPSRMPFPSHGISLFVLSSSTFIPSRLRLSSYLVLTSGKRGFTASSSLTIEMVLYECNSDGLLLCDLWVCFAEMTGWWFVGRGGDLACSKR